MDKYYIRPRCLVLHSDNGAAMKAAETLGLLAVRGVEFSHSRPRVSNDNPYSESLFKTMKYTGHMGKRNYHSLEECKKRVVRICAEVQRAMGVGSFSGDKLKDP